MRLRILLTAAVTLGQVALAVAQSPITAGALVPGGKQVVVGSQAGIEVREFPSLKRIRQLKTELENVHDLRFSPDGKTLAAGGGAPGDAGQIQLFRWPSGQAAKPHELHSDLVSQIRWLAAGKFVTASQDRTAIVVDKGKAESKLRAHSRGLTCLAAFSFGKSQWLLTGGLDRSLRCWKLGQSKPIRSLDQHRGAIRDVAVRPNQTGLPIVASASVDKTVRLWQPTIGRMMRFAKLKSSPLSLAWTPGGDRLAVGCSDGKVGIVDPDTAVVLHTLNGIDGWAYTLVMSRDGKKLLVAGGSGKMKVIAVPSGGN